MDLYSLIISNKSTIITVIITSIITGIMTLVIIPNLKASISFFLKKIYEMITFTHYDNEYLDWVIETNKFLPVLPTTLVPVTEEKHPRELDQLYISLDVTNHSEETSNICIDDAISKYRLLVILGDPGSGKTTILHYLALTFARAKRSLLFFHPPEGESNIEKYKTSKNTLKNIFHLDKSPLPIFFFLNRLRDIESWADKDIIDAITDEWKARFNLCDIPEDFFKNKIKKGECIFLFDAFDELATNEAREAIANRIGELAMAVPSGNRFIVTSRIVGYNGQLANYGFKTLTIQRLSREMIERLINKWYSCLDDSLYQNELAKRLMEQIEENPRIYELAINPMLLSLIALVQYLRGIIPDQRHILYDECIKILIERRYASQAIRAEFDRELPSEDAMRIIRKIALDMHERNEREITRNEMIDKLVPDALETLTSRARAAEPRIILSNIERRSQLLIERGFNENGLPLMSFSHLTFQEYLTSVSFKESAVQKGAEFVTNDLIEKYEHNPKWWKEVALLYAAQLDGSKQIEFIERLEPKITDDQQIN